MNSRVMALLAVGLLTTAAACGSGSEASTPTTLPAGAGCVAPGAPALNMPYATEDGVEQDLLSLDIYPVEGADCGSSPVVIYVHGGGWRRGDKAGPLTIDAKKDLATEQGWVLVSVNYRLSEPSGDESVTYPAHPTDVGRAVAFVEENISPFGGDPNAVVLMGHSAGAGIVSLVGAEPSFITDAGGSGPNCVVSLDTEAYDIARTMSTGGGATVDTYENAFGTDPDTWAEASPMQQLDDDDPVPDFLVITRGTPERVAQSKDFAAAVEKAGASSTVVVANGQSHADVNRLVGEEDDTIVTPPIIDFVAACTD